MRDFIQAKVAANVKQKEEQSQRAFPGESTWLRWDQGAYLIAR
jgi:hypothetical protein